jgi:hypothetical protein
VTFWVRTRKMKKRKTRRRKRKKYLEGSVVESAGEDSRGGNAQDPGNGSIAMIKVFLLFSARVKQFDCEYPVLVRVLQVVLGRKRERFTHVPTSRKTRFSTRFLPTPIVFVLRRKLVR